MHFVLARGRFGNDFLLHLFCNAKRVCKTNAGFTEPIDDKGGGVQYAAVKAENKACGSVVA